VEKKFAKRGGEGTRRKSLALWRLLYARTLGRALRASLAKGG